MGKGWAESCSCVCRKPQKCPPLCLSVVTGALAVRRPAVCRVPAGTSERVRPGIVTPGLTWRHDVSPRSGDSGRVRWPVGGEPQMETQACVLWPCYCSSQRLIKLWRWGHIGWSGGDHWHHTPGWRAPVIMTRDCYKMSTEQPSGLVLPSSGVGTAVLKPYFSHHNFKTVYDQYFFLLKSSLSFLLLANF